MTVIDKARVNGPRADQMKERLARFVETFEPLRPDLTDGQRLFFAWEENVGDIWVMDVTGTKR
jgi:hypothetical protein